MLWKKLGCVFNVTGSNRLKLSHAQLPVVLPLSDDTIRVYFASRDENNVSRPFFFEATIINDEFKVTYENDEPLLEIGRKGQFDDSGVMFSSWLKDEDKLLMYYIGWTRKVSVPYQLAIGLAVSEDGGMSWKRYSEGPILNANHVDTFCVSRPVVHQTDQFVMLYLSSEGWVQKDQEYEISYTVGLTKSDNPFFWGGEKKRLEFFPDEYACSPSSILPLGDEYYVFISGRKVFAFRDETDNAYRIYCTKTRDFKTWSQPWVVKGLEPEGSGFDSKMSEYPWCFKLKDNIYCVYNGDGFGKTGIGLAKLVKL
ncbi:MAG: hypothetical protein NZT61_04975 [Deltaproteobacteria bacterium]|nr:hypothetical protein [Deltaproteobacteria bacterium]MCX7953058.1 hypothetical protein [Deltaproteobacteria bacterium]